MSKVQCVNGKWSWAGQKFSDAPRECNRLLTPTIVLGHEEDDDDRKFWATLSTGVPSVGIITRLWRDGDYLKGDAGDVHPLAENAVKMKAVRKVSCEIYDNFEDEGVDYGMALRRVALLGGEIPQVKTLADLPMPDKLGNIHGIELFATGLHPTQDGEHNYTTDDLDAIVANFQRLSTCGTQVKMSERVFHVFHEVRKPKSKVFEKDGRWYWPGCNVDQRRLK